MRFDLYEDVPSLDGTERLVIAKAGRTRTTTVDTMMARAGTTGVAAAVAAAVAPFGTTLAGKADAAATTAALALKADKTDVVASTDITYNVLTYGAVGDGVADDTAAVQSAITALTQDAHGGRLLFPAGRYRIGSHLQTTLSGVQSLVIEGVSETASELIWFNDTNGWTVNIAADAFWLRSGSNPGPTVQRRNIAFVRSQATTGRTAFTVQGTVAANGSAGLLQVVSDGFCDRGDNLGGGWAVGALYHRTGQTTTKRGYIHAGSDGGAAAMVGVKITTTAEYISVDHHLSDLRMSGGSYLLEVGDYIQGVTLTDFTCVGSRVVTWQGVAGHGCDMLKVSNGHCGGFAGGVGLISTANINAVDIQGCYLLGGGVGAMINLENTTGGVIGGNLLFGPGILGANAIRVANDSSVNALDPSVNISGNTIKVFDVACIFAGATSNARFSGNLIGNTNVTCTDTTGNTRNECQWNKHYSGLTYGPDQSRQTSFYFDDGQTRVGSRSGYLIATSPLLLAAGGSLPAGQLLTLSGFFVLDNTVTQRRANAAYTEQYFTVAGATVPQVQLIASAGTATGANTGKYTVAASFEVLGDTTLYGAGLSRKPFTSCAETFFTVPGATVPQVQISAFGGAAGDINSGTYSVAGSFEVLGRVRVPSLPGSGTGLPSGTLWNNAGVVNVVP